ncbi:hypothetical protein LTR85_002993 [Meristemomyces frigidus]|nr:hypothetical protein LTR85_002993 [Meristemomyces frigidus]
MVKPKQRSILTLEKQLGFCVKGGISKLTKRFDYPVLNELRSHFCRLREAYKGLTPRQLRASTALKEEAQEILERLGPELWPERSCPWLADCDPADPDYPEGLLWKEAPDREKLCQLFEQLIIAKCIRQHERNSRKLRLPRTTAHRADGIGPRVTTVTHHPGLVSPIDSEFSELTDIGEFRDSDEDFVASESSSSEYGEGEVGKPTSRHKRAAPVSRKMPIVGHDYDFVPLHPVEPSVSLVHGSEDAILSPEKGSNTQERRPEPYASPYQQQSGPSGPTPELQSRHEPVQQLNVAGAQPPAKKRRGRPPTHERGLATKKRRKTSKVHGTNGQRQSLVVVLKLTSDKLAPITVRKHEQSSVGRLLDPTESSRGSVPSGPALPLEGNDPASSDTEASVYYISTHTKHRVPSEPMRGSQHGKMSRVEDGENQSPATIAQRCMPAITPCHAVSQLSHIATAAAVGPHSGTINSTYHDAINDHLACITDPLGRDTDPLARAHGEEYPGSPPNYRTSSDTGSKPVLHGVPVQAPEVRSAVLEELLQGEPDIVRQEEKATEVAQIGGPSIGSSQAFGKEDVCRGGEVQPSVRIGNYAPQGASVEPPSKSNSSTDAQRSSRESLPCMTAPDGHRWASIEHVSPEPPDTVRSAARKLTPAPEASELPCSSELLSMKEDLVKQLERKKQQRLLADIRELKKRIAEEDEKCTA